MKIIEVPDWARLAPSFPWAHRFGRESAPMYHCSIRHCELGYNKIDEHKQIRA